MSLDFLLEIGTEEIPHWMIPGAIEQLAKIDLLEASPRSTRLHDAWSSAHPACPKSRPIRRN